MVQAPTAPGSPLPSEGTGDPSDFSNSPTEGQCLEKRVYYRVISGLHASISTHVCYDMFDKKTQTWGPDLSCFIERIATHPERLQNIYFDTVLMLRALARVGPYLAAYDICGDEVDSKDETGKARLAEVIGIANLVGKFDEKALFTGTDANVLKEEFKGHFRNVSRIMDCVGCDKCKLWGKIQVTGLGTALKILFEIDESALDPIRNPGLLQRSEVVALINTLHRLTESLHAVSEFRKLWAARDPSERKIPLIHPPLSKDPRVRDSALLHLSSSIIDPTHISSAPQPTSHAESSTAEFSLKRTPNRSDADTELYSSLSGERYSVRQTHLRALGKNWGDL